MLRTRTREGDESVGTASGVDHHQSPRAVGVVCTLPGVLPGSDGAHTRAYHYGCLRCRLLVHHGVRQISDERTRRMDR